MLLAQFGLFLVLWWANTRRVAALEVERASTREVDQRRAREEREWEEREGREQAERDKPPSDR